MSNLDERAMEIIKNYARGHAGTAFSAGQVGGQFGADTAALTALTVKMIKNLCDLYGIKDSSARNVHIASAVARLTLKGTVIARTTLNWFPILGPLANSGATYFLTKRAGEECIRDIKMNRMNLLDQIKLAAGRGAVTFGSNLIHEAATSITDDVLQEVALDSKVMANVLSNGAIRDTGKLFISSVLESVTKAKLEGRNIDVRKTLEDKFFDAIAAGIFDYKIRIDGKYVSNKEESIKFLEKTRNKFPFMQVWFDNMTKRYKESYSEKEKTEIMEKIAAKADEAIGFLRNSDIGELYLRLFSS